MTPDDHAMRAAEAIAAYAGPDCLLTRDQIAHGIRNYIRAAERDAEIRALEWAAEQACYMCRDEEADVDSVPVRDKAGDWLHVFCDEGAEDDSEECDAARIHDRLATLKAQP